MKIRTYSELIMLPTFEDRFEYLKLSGVVGKETFGHDRYLNQALYKWSEWKQIRDRVIVRDNGCDLGVVGNEVNGKIIVHHMNPISKEDIVNRSDLLLNPEYLITVSMITHEAIHYSDNKLLKSREPVIRSPNDMCPWRM